MTRRKQKKRVSRIIADQHKWFQRQKDSHDVTVRVAAAEEEAWLYAPLDGFELHVLACMGVAVPTEQSVLRHGIDE